LKTASLFHVATTMCALSNAEYLHLLPNTGAALPPSTQLGAKMTVCVFGALSNPILLIESNP
jgi:hypothetical protein